MAFSILKSEKKLILTLVCSVVFNVGIIAQVPQYIKRYSGSAKTAHLRDSVVNAIILNPGFQWIARSDTTYLGVAIKPAINIEWPKAGQIIQRANDNKAWLYVKGTCNPLIDSVKITATAISGGATKSKNLKTISGVFEGEVQLLSGSYTLTTTELYNSGLPVIANPRSSSVSQVGVAVQAAVNIECPKDGQVIQRANDNKAWLYIKGTCNPAIDSVQINAISIVSGASKSKNLKVTSGIFEGAIQLIGGDYMLAATELYNNGSLVTTNAHLSSVSRVGVGEVLMAWGHSFMTGSIGTNARDLRSRTIPTVRNNPDYPNNNFFQNISELPVTFKHLDEGQVGPFAEESWIFSGLADTLVNRLQVPVLIYSAAFGGSNIYQNAKNIKGEPFGYTWFGDGVWQNNGFPFKSVKATFEQYVPVTGLRGVFAAHGVNDHVGNHNEPVDFTSNFNHVIDHIRTVAAGNSPNLAFILGMEDANFSAINNQLVNIINNDPDIYMGIDLRDPTTHGSWRDDSYGTDRGHFVGTLGLEKYLGLWANAIQNSFFTNTTPIVSVVNPALMN